jgi:hypothetical protein
MKRAVVVGIACLVIAVVWFLSVEPVAEPASPNELATNRDEVGRMDTLAAVRDSQPVDAVGELGGNAMFGKPRSTMFRGRVLDSHGSPPRDAVVSIDRDDQRIVASSCTSDGYFEIATEVGGVITIVATSSGWASRPRRLRAVVGRSHDVGTLLIEPIDPIIGKIVDELDHPIPGATVLAVANGTGRERRGNANTEADGTFRLLPRLPVTVLEIDAIGFVSRTIEVESLPVRVEMERAIEHRGRVIDAQSEEAVPNAFVDTQRCGPDGSFQLARSRSSDGTVVVRAHGYAASSVELPDRTDAPITIRLHPLENLSGIVLDPDGQPLPDALVQRVGPSQIDPPIQVRSDLDGRFRLPIDRSCAGMIEASKGHLRARAPLPTSREPGQEVVLRTERTAFATVVGRLPPLADPAAAVITLTHDEAPARFARLDPRGQFRFDDVEPGRVALAAYSENSTALRNVRMRPHAADAKDGIVLDLEGGERREVFLEPTTGRSNRVRGSARDHGEAAGHLAAILTPLSGRLNGSHRRRVNVSAHGEYEFADVVEGRYRVALVNRIPIEVTDYSIPLEELELCSTTIDVSAGDHIIDLATDTDLLVFAHTSLVKDLRLSQRETRESRLDLRRARTGFLVPRESLMLRVVTADGVEVTQPIPPLGDREIDLRSLVR